MADKTRGLSDSFSGYAHLSDSVWLSRQAVRLAPRVDSLAINLRQEASRIDFYEDFIRLVGKRGLKREEYQTPLEFAAVVGMGDAAIVTAAYNRVRFGAAELSTAESRQLEEALGRIRKSVE